MRSCPDDEPEEKQMSLAENYLIGMDLGTTNVKAILMGDTGEVVASASRENHLLFPGPSQVEQSADEWWDNAAAIFREITAAAGPEIVSRIRGISISSQTVTMLPVDRDGHPLRGAMIWMDARSPKEMHYISLMLGHDHMVEMIGAQPDVAFLPNKILWFKNNEPELFAKTAKVLQASSYINYKLTGVMSMDMDQAVRTQCLNIHTLKWEKEIGDVMGVNLDELLPQPKQPTDIIGYVTDAASKETGLMSGIPVAAGASDAMASIYATGMSKMGDATESSGTTSLVFVGSEKQSACNIPVVTKPCMINGIPYVFDAPISTTGAALRWYLNAMGEIDRQEAEARGKNVYTYINEVADQVPAGSNGVMFFPYLMGERAPLWNSHARGMFIGMSLSTKHEDFTRAVFEGTAYAVRHVIETIKMSGGTVDSLRITGGGAKSRTWSKIKASMLRVPILVLDEKSGDVPFGDTLIAGQATGVFPDLAKVTRELVTINEVIQPDEAWADRYDQLYPFYVDLYQALDKDLLRLRNKWLELNR